MLSVVVQKDRGGGTTAPDAVTFLVSYEFSAHDSSQNVLVCVGKQTTRYGFRFNDIAAVRYWPKWLRISQIVDRAV